MSEFRFALFTDSAPQLLERALVRIAQAAGFELVVKVWGFTSPLAAQEELKTFAPDCVCYWVTAEGARTGALPEIEPLMALPYQWCICNLSLLEDGIYGNYGLRAAGSLRRRLSTWNHTLLTLAERYSQLHLIDVEAITARLGRERSFDGRLWEMASIALTQEAVEIVAERMVALLRAMRGGVRKVLVTDLDDTFWSGIVSDVGAEGIAPEGPGRVAYRAWLKGLAARGILLAIASRNDEAMVREAFAREDLNFSLDDFAAIEVAWDRPKSAMLQSIATRLGVHTNSLVFIDDREENRNEVRAQLPEVFVPEMPEESACWMETLSALTVFETLSVTEDDTLRAASIKANAARQQMAEALSPEAYIARLEQVLTPEVLTRKHLDRAAQLSQRCNRFNMCGTRHTTAELEGRTGWVYRLKDRYGDMGMISLVVLEGNQIVTWVMSCRAFGRGVERLILEHLKSVVPTVCGAYVATERNGLCATVYSENGIPLP